MIRALTLDEVGRRLGVSAMTVRRRINDGEIDAVNVGTKRYPRLRVTETALKDYLDAIAIHPKGTPR